MIVRSGRSKLKPLILLLILAVITASVYFFVLKKSNDEETAKTGASHSQEQTKIKEDPRVEPLPSVRAAVDEWTSQNSGEYSVVVTDLATGTELASHRPDEAYFAASIYKLYVAYLGYLDIQNGENKLEDPFLGDWNRQECLDKMIRESHSPCAEKLWAEQGKEKSTERLKKYGLTGTSMLGLTTTAYDVNIILKRLYDKKELNQTHTDLYLESLKNNIYRDVLPKALPDLVVRDKVGFRELVEYHDVGLVTLPNGRAVAVTLLTANAGTSRMINLTKVIFEPLVASTQ